MFGRGNGLLFAAEGTAAPSGAQPTPPAAAAAPPAAVSAPAGDTPPVAADGTIDPAWLNTRLERERSKERSKLLKEIGVSDPAAAAKLVADEQARLAAAKTLETKVSESETALAAERARVAALSGTVAAIATERMTGLTEAQRNAVKAIAGEDAAAQLNAIAALAPTWSAPTAAATATGATTAAAPPAVAATPATTAPGQTAPAGTTTTSQPDHKAEYKRLKAENPVQAAAYLNKHEALIYPRA